MAAVQVITSWLITIATTVDAGDLITEALVLAPGQSIHGCMTFDSNPKATKVVYDASSAYGTPVTTIWAGKLGSKGKANHIGPTDLGNLSRLLRRHPGRPDRPFPTTPLAPAR